MIDLIMHDSILLHHNIQRITSYDLNEWMCKKLCFNLTTGSAAQWFYAKVRNYITR